MYNKYINISKQYLIYKYLKISKNTIRVHYINILINPPSHEFSCKFIA